MNKIINLGDLLDSQKDAHKIAIIDLSGHEPRSFSFKQIDEMACALAESLKERGLPDKSPIALLGPNSAEFFVSYLAVLKAGYTALLLNYKLPQQPLQKILTDSDCKLIFCDADRISSCPQNIPVINLNHDLKNIRPSVNFKSYHPTADDIAFCLYTSGAGGKPKGVTVSHKAHA